MFVSDGAYACLRVLISLTQHATTTLRTQQYLGWSLDDYSFGVNTNEIYFLESSHALASDVTGVVTHLTANRVIFSIQIGLQNEVGSGVGGGGGETLLRNTVACVHFKIITLIHCKASTYIQRS